jgi:micrococcal nuclease
VRGAAAEDVARRVVEIIGPLTLRLADGTELRLAGIEVEAGNADAATAVLRALLDGEALVLTRRAGGWDRWGRELALAEMPDGRSLQEELLRQGLAFAAPDGADDAEDRRHLEIEAAAREGRRGIWGRRPGPIRPAERVRAPEGAFVLVEGRVLAVGETADHLYLNFGADRRTDFTLRAARTDARRWERQGFVPAALRGRRVRARGWLLQAGGPMIELVTPLQVEVLP